MLRCLATFLALTLSSLAADFYISPQGNDSWTGTLDSPNADMMDGPFASMARAQSAVRALRSTSPDRALTIMLREGTYYLPSPPNSGTLNFTTTNDSGSSLGTITWTNYPGETPILNGGIPVGAGGWGHTWTQGPGSLWQTSVPAGTPNFEFLYYNGERRLRSRLASNTGLGYYMLNGTCTYQAPPAAAPRPASIASCNVGTFFRVLHEISPATARGCPSVTNAANQKQSKCLDRFEYDSRDPIAAWANVNSSGSVCGGLDSAYPTGDVELILFDAWTVDILRISCVDTTKHVIYFTGPAQGNTSVYNFFGPTAGHRYIIENARGAFDAAQNAGQTGTWFLDRSTFPWTLNYLANPGEYPNSDSVVIPQLQAATPTSGSLLNASNINFVTFSGITFEMDGWTVPRDGFVNDENGESTVPAAVDCESCQQVTFDGITIRHTAASGLQIAGQPGNVSTGGFNNAIQNSAFYDIGSCGVHIGHHPSGSDVPSSVVQSVKVSNNIVQGYSRVFPSGEGIAQGNGHDISYTHNDVTDGYHAGISICLLGCPSDGFTSNGTNILTQYNHIWNVIQGITTDGGSLYYNVGMAKGSGTGNSILNNLVHDVTDSQVIDRGVVLNGRRVDVVAAGFGGSGIYIDNQSAGIDVEDNVVFRVSDPAVHVTNGPTANQAGHTFRNNIFALSPTGMFEQQTPWPQGCGALPSPQVTLVNNIFYFNPPSAESVQAFSAMRGCAYSCGLAYNQFQNFQGNLYWRTDGTFNTDGRAFHILTRPPNPISSCGQPGSPNAAWTFMTFAQWQTQSQVNKMTINMNEDAGGTVSVNPGFGASSTPQDFVLTTNPVSGFDYTRTNDTIQNAGRVQPQIFPPAVPHTFPTFYLKSF